MSTPARRKHWDDVYGRKAESEVGWFEAAPSRSAEPIEQTGVGRSAPIIDIGGGLSRLADSLVAAGYADITVLDISGEAVRQLMARQPPDAPVHAIVSDVTAWRAGNEHIGCQRGNREADRRACH